MEIVGKNLWIHLYAAAAAITSAYVCAREKNDFF